MFRTPLLNFLDPPLHTCIVLFVADYRTGALLGACTYTSTEKKYALIREMRLIKSAFFNAGILRTAAKYALNSEYAPISDMRLITRQYGMSIRCVIKTWSVTQGLPVKLDLIIKTATAVKSVKNGHEQVVSNDVIMGIKLIIKRW